MSYKIVVPVVRNVIIAVLYCVIIYSCSSNKDLTPAPPDITDPPEQENINPSGEIMFQTFYWDVPSGGTWYTNLENKVADWQSAGVTALWLPVVTKGQTGAQSMGYDLYDYFDFGQFNQHGTTETRFGSYAELTSFMQKATDNGMKLIADIVINHNSGGNLEFSPYSNKNYWTSFTPKSGKFIRNYEHFHPNSIHAEDEDYFGGFPDLCHDMEYVKEWLYKRPDGVAKFYRDSLGFDGWRFDFVKGFSPDVVKDWITEVGGVSIGEFWDGDVNLVNNWCISANSGAFDFPLYYAMDAAFDGGNLSALNGAGLVAKNPAKAYTFVANHDADDISNANKFKAYAYIMTAEGTPFIFYKDYESNLDKAILKQLIQIKKTLAAGSTTNLFSSSKEFIFRRNGKPGLVAYFNNESVDKDRTVQTTWANTILKDYTGANPDVQTDASGNVSLHCKWNSYAIYAPK